MSEASEALIRVGRAFPGAECSRSDLHPLLQRLAEGYAEWMQRHNRQGGHHHFQDRYDAVKAELGLEAVEITAESWPWQGELDEVAREMWHCWEQSPGHWRVASVVHKFVGAEMLKGRRVWYACVIAAD